VGIADLSALADNYGATGLPGWTRCDFNADGVVGIADLSAVADNYGVTTVSPANSPIPEPAAIAVLMLGPGVLVGRRARGG